MGRPKMIFLLAVVFLAGPALAKKHHNPLWQWMYMRDPFNYTHSVQVASNKPNNQVDKKRQRYFDSTSYNYQQYYTHDGKLNYSNTANSSAITMWLESYDDLRRTLSSKEAHYRLLGKFPRACKFRYPIETYHGNSFSHALVARPHKRKIHIRNGNYQAYHRQRHDNLQLLYRYASEHGLKAQRNAIFKGFFPKWYHIDKPSMHYPMPFRRFRVGEIKPNYMRDQWRLPPCLSPKPFKAPKKGFIHKAFGELPNTSNDPRWYQGFQKYPHVWDDMCESPTGLKMKMCKQTKRNFNSSVTPDGAFKLWQQKRILARPHMNNVPINLKEQFRCRFLATAEQIKDCTYKVLAGKAALIPNVTITSYDSSMMNSTDMSSDISSANDEVVAPTTTLAPATTQQVTTTQSANDEVVTTTLAATGEEGNNNPRKRRVAASPSSSVTIVTIPLVPLLLSILFA